MTQDFLIQTPHVYDRCIKLTRAIETEPELLTPDILRSLTACWLYCYANELNSLVHLHVCHTVKAHKVVV